MYQSNDVEALYGAFQKIKHYSPYPLRVRQDFLADKTISRKLILSLLLEDALEEKEEDCLKLFLEFCNTHQVDIFEHFNQVYSELTKPRFIQNLARNLKLLLQDKDIENIQGMRHLVIQVLSKPKILFELYQENILPPSFPKQDRGIVCLALKNGNFEVVKYLLEHGFPFENLSRGMLFNWLSSKHENHIIDLLRFFHQHDVPWGAEPDKEQYSMARGFKQALLTEQFKVLDAMIECGGYVDYSVTKQDISLLHVTTTQGNLRTSKWLIKHGVDIHALEEGVNALVPLIWYHSNLNEESKMNEFFDLFNSLNFDIEASCRDALKNIPAHGIYVQDTLNKWMAKLEKEKLEKEFPQIQMSSIKARI